MKIGVFAFGVLLVFAASSILLSAKDKDTKGKEKAPSGSQMVDSGSYGVFQDGRRIATEIFSISTNDGVSTVDSRIEQPDTNQANQTSKMQITSDGSLLHYQWHQLQGSNAELTLVPDQDFLKEHIVQGTAKPQERPFLMPKTSVVLDDNFTVQREVFAWRYLASACRPEKTELKCATASFGTVDPQQMTSVPISAEPKGSEELTVHGVKRQLWRMDLKSDSENWSLWLDPQDHYKLIRLTREGVDMEVVRD